MNDLVFWLESNFINYEQTGNLTLSIPNFGTLLLISPKGEENLLFDEDLHIIIDEGEDIFADSVDYFTFQFGENFYYTTKDINQNFKLNILKYIGDCTAKYDIIHLGIHGKYELCNGSREYSDWCKKAKFIGCTCLGLCEKNTLAGSLDFQLACQKNKIDFVHGIEASIHQDRETYLLKLYVKNEEGWSNLLYINSFLNVFNEDKRIKLGELSEFKDGLVAVINPLYMSKEYVIALWKIFGRENLYFQVDSIGFDSESLDRQYLENTNFLLKSKIEPILINDMYYLDEDEKYVKKILNTIKSESSVQVRNGQYMKTYNENKIFFENLFKDKFGLYFDRLIENQKRLAEQCNFAIQTGIQQLPQYKLTEEEKDNFGTSENLFHHLLKEGMVQKDFIGNKEYEKRLEYEVSIIKLGYYVDYFLILWDIVAWCKKNNILVGFGRGCFLPYQNKVITDKGYLFIEDIQIGDKVIGRYSIEEVIDKFQYEIDEDIIELELENGVKITCTKDHKFLLKTGRYIEAQYLDENFDLQELDEELKNCIFTEIFDHEKA